MINYVWRQFNSFQSKPGEVKQAVMDAIDIGYRHIDCAMIYENQQEVGEGLKAKFSDGTVKREDIFITSKVNIEGQIIKILFGNGSYELSYIYL